MGWLFQCRCRHSHHVGNIGCHTGDVGTWCMVHRCASVRPEAFRDFGALNALLNPWELGDKAIMKKTTPTSRTNVPGPESTRASEYLDVSRLTVPRISINRIEA